MEPAFGLLSLMKDIRAGKSIDMPGPIDLQAIVSDARARQRAAEHRDLTAEAYNAAVRAWLDAGQSSSAGVMLSPAGEHLGAREQAAAPLGNDINSMSGGEGYIPKRSP